MFTNFNSFFFETREPINSLCNLTSQSFFFFFFLFCLCLQIRNMPQSIVRCSEADRASTTSSDFQAWINSEITLFNNNNNNKISLCRSSQRIFLVRQRPKLICSQTPFFTLQFSDRTGRSPLDHILC